MVNQKFEYDSELDNFYIYTGNNEEIMGSLPMGSFLYDIGVSGNVVKLEVDNASKTFNVSPKILESAENASLTVVTNRTMIMFRFQITLAKKELVFVNSLPKEKISILA